MASFNERIGDLFTRHAVNLERFKSGEKRKALKFLKSMENDLVAELNRQDPQQHARTFYQQQKLQSLLKTTRDTIKTGYKNWHDQQQRDLADFAQLEMDFVAATINDTAGVELVTVGVSSQELRALVSNILIEGAPQKEWWKRQAASTEKVFSDLVRRGIYNGTPTADIARQLRGTDAFDGQLRRGVEALVRTSVTSVSTAARMDLFGQNDDILNGVQQRSVLDGRTTQICMSYSGMAWTLPDYEPIGNALPYNGGPPRHFGCRSTLVPLVKAFSQLDVTRKKGVKSVSAYMQRQGLEDAQIERMQASMDGTVPEDLNYEAWLKTKSEAFQKSVLGEGKWKLWKKGRLTFSQLVDENGRPLTLTDLRKTFGKAS